MNKHNQRQSVSRQGKQEEGKEKEPWWRRIIKILGIEAPVLTIIGVAIGVALCYFYLSKLAFWIDPLIDNAVKATIAVQPTVGQMPTYTLYPTYTPCPTNTPPIPTTTPTNTLVPPPITIDTMDSSSGWSTFSDPESWIEIRSIPGVRGNAIEISYTLQPGGWVGISKQISPELLPGTVGIRFSRSGSGASNTIELKLVYAPGPSGESVTFEHLWPTDTVGDWEQRKVVYSEHCKFACLDLGQVRTINFAISSREGGTPGSGTVAIDHVEGIR